MVRGAPFPQSSLPAKIDLFNEAIVCVQFRPSLPHCLLEYGPGPASLGNNSCNMALALQAWATTAAFPLSQILLCAAGNFG